LLVHRNYGQHESINNVPEEASHSEEFPLSRRQGGVRMVQVREERISTVTVDHIPFRSGSVAAHLIKESGGSCIP
jgi:hypothetical protein